VALAICVTLRVAPAIATQDSKESDAATRQYAVAVGLQNRKLYDLAIEEWQKFIKQFPKDSRQDKARHYLGTSYLQSGNLDQAIAMLSEVVAKYPKLDLLDASYLNLGVAHYQRAQKTGKMEDYALARESFTKLIEGYPKSEHVPRAIFYRGESDYHRGKTVEALAGYAQLIKNHPNSELAADAYYALAVGQEALKQYEAAVTTFRGFLEKFPKHAFATEATMRLGEALFAQKKYADASRFFERAAAVSDFPLADFALLRRARCLYEQGQVEDAADEYWNVPRKFPKTKYYDEAVLAGGKCFYHLGRYARAREGLELVADRATDQAAEAAHWLARTWLKEKQPEKALAVADRAVAKHAASPLLAQLQLDRADAVYDMPNRRAESVALYAGFAAQHSSDALAPQAQYMAAFAALGLGQHQVARDHARNFLAKYAAHELAPDVLFIQAESMLALEDPVSAAASFQQLARQFPKHASTAQARVRAGLALYMQKKYGDAIAALEPIAGKLADKALDAESFYLVGRSYAEQNNFAKAIPALRQSLATKPDWSQADEAILSLAHCLRQDNQVGQAIEQLNQLAAKFPKSEYIAEGYFRLGEYHYATGAHDQAVTHYRRVASEYGNSPFAPHAQYGVGWALFGKSDFAGCIQAIAELVKRYPQADIVPRSRYVRAMAYHQTGQYEPAIADIQAFLVSKPPQADLLDACYVLGLCQAGVKQYVQAAATFQTILKADPNYAGADKVTYELAWALKDSAKEADSIAAFALLATSYPRSPLANESLFRVAESHYDAGRYEEASKAYRETNEKAGQTELGEKSMHKIGWCLFKLNDFDKAAQAFTAQAARFPNGSLAPDAQFLAGECHFQRQQWKDAMDVYEKVVAAKVPNYHATALYRLGQCAGNQQQWAVSAAFHKQVLDQFSDFPQRPEARYGYGWALQNQEKLNEAVAEYEKVTEETSTETAAKARFMIGECYFAQKNHKEAIKNFLKVAYGYGHAEWVASAHFEAGRCFEVIKDRAQAVQSYKTVVEKYPDSPRAPGARERLKALGSP
jgi:TolA-binding protein